jgi:hypothetical protein
VGEAAERFWKKHGLGGKTDDILDGRNVCVAKGGALTSCFHGKFVERYGRKTYNRVMEARNRVSPEMADKLDTLMKHSNGPIKRFREGYKAQLDRTLAHIDQGDVLKIEPRFFHQGSGRWLRPDAELTPGPSGARFLDVKHWSLDYMREHLDDLVERMKTYKTNYPGGGVVELVGGYTAEILDELRKKLPSDIVVVPMF